MVASALIKHGPDHLEKMIDGLRKWLGQKKQPSVSHIQGLLSRANYHDASMFERANYMNALSDFRRSS